MRDIVGFYIGALYFPPERMHKWDEKNLEKGGIGGSEIWAIEITDRLENKGFHCIIFADCDEWHYSSTGVEYVPYKLFNEVCVYTKFKYFITSRQTYELSTNIKAEKIFLMCHDPFVLWADKFEDLHKELIYKIAYQSDFQKRLLQQKYIGLEDSDFFRTFQAINPELYQDIDISKKKNKMLWSSHKIRGARILIEKILPIIRREIPDFEIDVCGYVNDMEDNYFNADGVNVKGNVTKQELVRLQKESKIWIYPNWGRFEDGRINDETFCITAIENAFAKNAIVVADRTCFSSTLKGYSGFVGTEIFGDNDIIDESLIDEFAQQLAEQAIKILKDEELCQKLSNECYLICSGYTWDNAVKTFLEVFNDIKSEPLCEDIKNVVILTALSRPKNIDEMFESIKYLYSREKKIRIVWTICDDLPNRKEGFDVPEFINKMEEYRKTNPMLLWAYCPCEKDDGNKHYGGTLYNGALNYVKEQYFSNIDPWVYILDDDNTICPLMSETLYNAINIAEKQNKDIIYYNMMYENGVIAPLCWYTFRPVNDEEHYYPYYYETDPSQILMRYSFLKKIGFYEEIYEYDKRLWRILQKEFFEDNILFPEEWRGKRFLNSYQTTHDSINSIEEKEKWKELLLNDDIAKCCALSICVNDEGNKVFIVSSEIMKEIFEKYIL